MARPLRPLKYKVIFLSCQALPPPPLLVAGPLKKTFFAASLRRMELSAISYIIVNYRHYMSQNSTPINRFYFSFFYLANSGATWHRHYPSHHGQHKGSKSIFKNFYNISFLFLVLIGGRGIDSIQHFKELFYLPKLDMFRGVLVYGLGDTSPWLYFTMQFFLINFFYCFHK